MNYQARILVVDDDPALLEQAESILSPRYQVSLANSGTQALQFLRRGGEADLILLDILMPEPDGYQTLAEIRTLEQYQHIPVIFLTSLSDSASELQGLIAGAADYITKPFNTGILLARVELRLQTGYQLDEKKMEALPEPLTESEWKVARLLARSYSNDEIGHELHYALDTVKKTVSRILEKMMLKNRKDIRRYLK